MLRRKPREHVRNVEGKIIRVNAGVTYNDNKNKTFVDGKTAVNGLLVDTLPVKESTEFPVRSYVENTIGRRPKNRTSRMADTTLVDSLLRRGAKVGYDLNWDSGYGKGEIRVQAALNSRSNFEYDASQTSGEEEVVLRVGEGATIRHAHQMYINYAGCDLRGAEFAPRGAVNLENLDFSGALLDDAKFAVFAPSPTSPNGMMFALSANSVGDG